MLKNCISFVLTTCLLATVPVVAQEREMDPFSKLPKAEPFKIAPGSSFSASTSHTKQPSHVELEYPVKNKIPADLEEALNVIRKNYAGSINYESVIKSSIDSMLASLDPHSSYFDPAEYRAMENEQRSEYFGIGSTIINYEKYGKLGTYVIAISPDSPAAAAGLRFGDRILEVDGKDVSESTSDVVRDKVRGRNGTTVRLKLLRSSTGKHEIVDIRRGRVPQPSIADAYIAKPGIGYVDMSEGFTYTTSTELEAAIKRLRRQGMHSLILDLRGNTGGILEQAVRVVEKFIPAGNVIVSQRGRVPIDNRIWRSNNHSADSIPLVVLVDKSSASASEVVAGALQDYDRALIVGEKTFGKGLVQSVMNLPRGAGLAITTARYYTPSGRSIQRDYSNGNMYDYFSHREQVPAESRTVKETITRRKVYGGDGIEPDELIPSEELNAEQLALLDPIFFFTNEVVNGRVKGLEHLRSHRTADSNNRVGPKDYIVDERVLDAFTEFARDSSWSLASTGVRKQRSFVAKRIRYLMVMAAHGSAAAEKVLNYDDPQIAMAVEALPRAEQLARSARKTLYSAKNN